MKSISISTLAGRVATIHYHDGAEADAACRLLTRHMEGEPNTAVLTLGQPGCSVTVRADHLESVTLVDHDVQADVELQIDSLYEGEEFPTVGRA